ncbi:MAG: hypothetical protein WC516_01355 [Patescibacteria group bacterium]
MIEDYAYKKSNWNVKRDYQTKKFNNPYFNNNPEKKFNTKLYLKIIIAIFLVYLFVYSDLLKIKNVEVKGTDIIPQEELSGLVNNYLNHNIYFVFPRRNLLFLNKDGLKKELSSHYSLSKIDINKGWQKVSINIEEKVSSLLVYNQKDSAYYFADFEGAITRQLPIDMANKYKIKFPQLTTNQDLAIGKKIISARAVNFILELDKQLKAANYKIREYTLGGVDNVAFWSTDGWMANFDVNSDMQSALDNLNLLLKKKIKDVKKLDYIDLSLGEKVFVKMK